MGVLFHRLAEEGIYQNWVPVLDWLLDDERFQGWSSGYVGAFAKKIKRLPFVGDDTYFWDSAKKLVFPQNVQNRQFIIMMTKGDSEAKDLIRHIRNGIAHGNARIARNGATLYIEIVDYSKGGVQSAYICIPVGHIDQIFQLYQEIDQRTRNRY